MGHEKLDDIYKELAKSQFNLVPKPLFQLDFLHYLVLCQQC